MKESPPTNDIKNRQPLRETLELMKYLDADSSFDDIASKAFDQISESFSPSSILNVDLDRRQVHDISKYHGVKCSKPCSSFRNNVAADYCKPCYPFSQTSDCSHDSADDEDDITTESISSHDDVKTTDECCLGKSSTKSSRIFRKSDDQMRDYAMSDTKTMHLAVCIYAIICDRSITCLLFFMCRTVNATSHANLDVTASAKQLSKNTKT